MSSSPPPCSEPARQVSSMRREEQRKRKRMRRLTTADEEGASYLEMVVREAPPRPGAGGGGGGSEASHAKSGSGEEMDDESDSDGSHQSGDQDGDPGEKAESTLRENSMELERAKVLVSERDVIIRYLEVKLAGCQSELRATEEKLNGVEVSLKSKMDKQRKAYISTKLTLTENSTELERAKALLSEKDVSIRSLEEKLAGYQSELAAKEIKLIDVESTLRETSVELERAKDLLSEKDVGIRSLEQKLASYQSELRAKESKTNDFEASLRTEIAKQRKAYISTKTKLDTLIREKDGFVKEHQTLLKQMEDLKSRTANYEWALKEKDFMIQTFQETLAKERDDHKKEKVSHRNAKMLFDSTIRNLAKKKKQVENSIEKHRQAVKEAVEHCSVQSCSQIPPGSAVEEQVRSYILAVKELEETPNPFQDGATSQTPPVDTPTADASTAAAGRLVAAPPKSAQVEVMEEKAISTLPKPSTEVRRPGILDRVEGPQVYMDTPTAEGSTTVQEKGGPSLERETPGGVSGLQPSSGKHLISSLQMTDCASQGGVGYANPPLKKSKEEESSQGTGALKYDQSAVEDVTAQEACVVPSVDSRDGEQPAEDMDMGQDFIPVEKVEEPREDEARDKDEMEANTDASVGIKSQATDNDVTAVEGLPVKPETSFYRDQKLEDIKEERQIITADVREPFPTNPAQACPKTINLTQRAEQNRHARIRRATTPQTARNDAGRGSRGRGWPGGQSQ